MKNIYFFKPFSHDFSKNLKMNNHSLILLTELAIEEICRPEAEDVEDMDIDAGS